MIEIRDLDLRKQDCRCSDFAFGRCAEGVAGDKIHVGDLQECIFQCDVSRWLDIVIMVTIITLSLSPRNIVTNIYNTSIYNSLLFTALPLVRQLRLPDLSSRWRHSRKLPPLRTWTYVTTGDRCSFFYSEQIRCPNRVAILERYPSYFHMPS